MIKFLLCLLAPAVWAMESDVEVYYNNPPVAKIFYKGDMPESFFYEKNKNLFWSLARVYSTIRESFEELGFERAYFDTEYFHGKVLKNTTRFFYNIETNLFALVNLQSNETTLEPEFSSHTCSIHSSVFSKEKWEYPRPVSYWNGDYEVLNAMSLRYLDCFLHCLPNVEETTEFMPEIDWEKTLYKKVRMFGLNKAVARITVVCNNKKQFSISELHVNKEESEISDVTKLLTKKLVAPSHE